MPIVNAVREYLGVDERRRIGHDATVYILKPDFDEGCCRVGWKEHTGLVGWLSACARSMERRRETLGDFLLTPHRDPDFKPAWQQLLEYCDRVRWAEELGYV